MSLFGNAVQETMRIADNILKQENEILVQIQQLDQLKTSIEATMRGTATGNDIKIIGMISFASQKGKNALIKLREASTIIKSWAEGSGTTNPEDTAINQGLSPATNNMLIYLSEHNYGHMDYPTYSQDPVWQKLNQALIDEDSTSKIQTIDSIKSWVKEINPKYTGDPYSPFSVNCGACAFAVESRLNGNPSAVASKTNIDTDSGMELATGKKCEYMPIRSIEKHLKSQGAGSHLIIGINRYADPNGQSQSGHWFNAYYDGTNIYTIEGQSGETYEWPHDYGSISKWCALI